MNVHPTKSMPSIGAFWGDERGAELVEWVLVTVAVGLVGIGTLVAVREELARVFQYVIEEFVSWG